MGRMNQSTFKTLFEYGKKVYQGELDLGTAAANANAQNPEVAISSARHYITWYSKMKTGEFLTWNTNSDLLLYYAKRIIDEEGVAAGQLAIHSATQFAKHAARHDLEEDLDHLAAEKGIFPVGNTQPKETQTQKEAFQKWLKGLATRKYTEGTIYRYTRALEMAEEWLSIKLPCPVFMIASSEEFERCNQIIKAVPNFAAINQDHGHGDLSAALSLYAKFLVANANASSDWWPSLEEFDPQLSKEKWHNYISEIELPNHPTPMKMLKAMMILGGEASCKLLSDTYGGHPSAYVGCATNLGRRVKKHFNLPACMDGDQERYFPFPFIGKHQGNSQDNYLYRIRPELLAALNEIDLSAINPYYEAEHKMGQFDSWEIIDENTAIKHCDKSFFEHKGSGIPKDIVWFFDAEELDHSETKQITLIFKGKSYYGRIANDPNNRRRLFWNADLANLFNTYNSIGSTATFMKLKEDTYEVSIKGGEKEMTIKDKITAIKTYIAARGFNYEGDLIENFYLSLKSKPFVILAGTSGTGKTKLVEYFAEAIGAQIQLVPVRPDWSDSSDLFGHKDLSGNFHPGAIIDFLKAATENPAIPHFLCLDEMNLARVEYYMSDLLSIIETRKFNEQRTVVTKPLIGKDYCRCSNGRNDYGEIGIPENLYIIGTVNMDETTFPFSKKVLDRANTIEFSFVDLTKRTVPCGMVTPLNLENSFLRSSYLHLIDCDDDALIDEICSELDSINHILLKANLHVGYRVRDEISFYMMNNKIAELLARDAAFDYEIMQKILPRIQGSSAAIKSVLAELFKKCAGDYTGFNGSAAYEQMEAYLDSRDCKYPNSAKKIAFMMRRYEEDGFTSYWL